jgi:CRP-like cAMP-binding protein
MELKSAVQEFPAGHVFFQLGEAGKRLFLLEKGRVQTFRNLGERKLIISELVGPGIFGEIGCIGQCIYHCSAQAMEPSRVRVVAQREFEALLEEHPQVTRRLLDLVGQRFVHVLLDLEGMSFRPLLPRLAALLLERAEGGSVQNMTHKELAEHLRVYRESATTVLGELRKAGIIAIERRQIRILDRARLERASRE